MRTPCSGRSLLLVTLSVGVLSGCGCDLRGCGPNGLAIHLTSLPIEPYMVELFVPRGRGDPQAVRVWFYECDGRELCQRNIEYPDQFPSHVVVRVTTASGSVVKRFPNIDYEAHYLNGRSCGVTCVNAFVTMDVPA